MTVYVSLLNIISVKPMNKNSAKKIAPLVVLPIVYLGTVMIHGSHPQSFFDFIETILFISIISLPVSYTGMFLVVLPVEAMLKTKRFSSFFLIFSCSIIGGSVFLLLDILFIPGHKLELSQFLFVLPMGAFLGLSVSLSYLLISSITRRSSGTREKASRAP